MNKIVLVVSPHPDDETLGCGGTILKHISQGDKVYCCFFTYALNDYTEEQKEKRLKLIEDVSKVYDFEKYFNLGFPAGGLDTIPKRKLIDIFSKVIEEVKPEIIYTTGNTDVTEDHGIVYRTVMACTKPSYAPFVRKILAYEVISSTNWAFADEQRTFLPNYFIEITPFIEKKLEIMTLFNNEFKRSPHPRSKEGIKALAKYRGVSVNVEFAEAFQVLRQIEK